MDVKFLRKEIRKQRQNLPITLQQQFSTIICRKIVANPIFQASQTVGFYYPQCGEVDTLQLLKLSPCKKFYLPIVNTNDSTILTFGLHTPDSVLVNNRFGIPEPDSTNVEVVSARDLDLVIAPLVIFDPNCNRVGMGCGYYDNTFAFKKTIFADSVPFLIGVAYELQKVEELIANSWDVKMQMIVTEREVYLCDK